MLTKELRIIINKIRSHMKWHKLNLSIKEINQQKWHKLNQLINW